MARGNYLDGLANRVLAASVKGEAVPFNVQEAAKRVQAGRGRPSDGAVMMQYMGEKRSGARPVKKAAQWLQKVERSFESISRESSIMSATGGSPVDQARFLNTLLREMDVYANTKLVKGIAYKASEYIGASPRLSLNILKSIGRFARLGGAVAMVASAGVEIAEHYFASNQQAARAQGRSLDVARALGVSPHRRREAMMYASQRYDRTVKTPRRLYDYLFPGAREEQIEQEASEELQNVARARTLARELGARPDEALAREAARRGVQVGDLHPQVVSEVLDAETSDARKRLKAENRDQVDRALELQTKGRNAARWATLGISTFFETSDEALRASLERQFQKKALEALAQQQKDYAVMMARRRAAGQFPESFTVAEVQQQRRQEEAAQAQARSFRSRHKAVILD